MIHLKKVYHIGNSRKAKKGAYLAAMIALVIAIGSVIPFGVLQASLNVSAADEWNSSSGIEENGDFTLIAVPDMQYIAGNNPENLSKITGWINENKELEAIRFVMFLGDMTDDNKKSEWESVTAATDELSVPFSVIYGNRDMNRDKDSRNLKKFISAYPLSKFQSYSEYGGAFENSSLNTYYKFEAGGLKYLIMALEFAPRDAVLEWANEIISANPDHNVIITTHGYLDDDGNIISDSSEDSFLNYSYLGGEGNNGSGIWDKLVSKHKNIVLLLCGHRGDGDVIRRTDIGDHGNSVQTIMVNGTEIDEATNGKGGMILKIHFKNGSGDISCEYYSTITEKYYKAENQFTKTLCVVGNDGSVSLSGKPIDQGDSALDSGSDTKPNEDENSPNSHLIQMIAVISVLLALLIIAMILAVVKQRKAKRARDRL